MVWREVTQGCANPTLACYRAGMAITSNFHLDGTLTLLDEPDIWGQMKNS